MPRILIAEDEPDIRELVRISLEFAGFEVIATHNGQELLDRIRDVDPDLVLTDVRMPRVTGYEACRVIKEDPTLAHIPVVFLSAKGQEEEVEEGLKAGALDYILKPFAPDELAGRLNELLERAHKEAGKQVPKPADQPASQTPKPVEEKKPEAPTAAVDGQKPEQKKAVPKSEPSTTSAPAEDPSPAEDRKARIAALRKGIARWEKDKKPDAEKDSKSPKGAESKTGSTS